jgi:hypothetical protein
MYNTKVFMIQNSLGPSVYGNLFTMDQNEAEITAYVDGAVGHAVKHNSKYKVALLIEPPAVMGPVYEWVYRNHTYFDLIMTHDKGLASIPDSKFVYYPIWPKIWIPPDDRKLYDKTKMTSAIFSAQNNTRGHKFRHEIVKAFENSNVIDLYGREYNPIENKTEGIADYRYHIVVENQECGYASEKVNDAFCCGAIPIYWGNKNSNIHDFYNCEGVLMFETIDELKNIMNNVISEEHYSSKKKVVEQNYNLAKDLTLDLIYWEYGIKNFAEQRGLVSK